MKLVNFIKNILFLYIPDFRKNKENNKKVKNAIRVLKKEYSSLYNPLTEEFTPKFYQLIKEVISKQKKLLDIYRDNINGNVDRRYEFEKSLADSVFNKYHLSLIDLDLSQIIESLDKKGKKSIQTIDITFKNRLQTFKVKGFTKLKKYLIDHSKIGDLIQFNFNLLFNNIHYSTLMDLIYLTGNLPENIEFENDMVLNHLSSDNEIDLPIVLNIFNKEINTDFLCNLIIFNKKDGDYTPKIKESKTDFPDYIYNEILEKYKIDREKYLLKESHRVIQERKKKLFGEKELSLCFLYDAYNNGLLIDSGVGSFKYIDQINVTRSFYITFFKDMIHPTLKEFILEADFINKDKKAEFDKTYDSFLLTKDSVLKFEEDIQTPTFSSINFILNIVKNGVLTDKDKLKGKESISTINKYADKLVQDSISSSLDLSLFIEEVKIDLESQFPQILNNAYFFLDENNELQSKIIEVANILSMYNGLMRSISVNLKGVK